LSTNFTPGSNNGASSNSSSFVSRREMRASDMTGALPAISPTTGADRYYTGSSEFENLIQSLRELFEKDRQVAIQPDATRCGICYLHFSVNALRYREEGFYVCEVCEHALSNQRVPMLRKQHKL